MKEYQEWIAKAEQDFDTAQFNLKGRKVEAGVFFLHQCAEKALKALSIKKLKELLKTHDLLLLARKLNAPENITNYCKKLSPAYQYTRYPEVASEEELDAKSEDFSNYTKEILKWVKKNL